MPHALAIAARSPLGRAAARWRAGLRPTALKPLTYSVTHFMVAVLVAYALTRDWRVALGVGLIEPAVQTVAYVLHERAWSRVGSRRTRPAATSC